MFCAILVSHTKNQEQLQQHTFILFKKKKRKKKQKHVSKYYSCLSKNAYCIPNETQRVRERNYLALRLPIHQLTTNKCWNSSAAFFFLFLMN